MKVAGLEETSSVGTSWSCITFPIDAKNVLVIGGWPRCP